MNYHFFEHSNYKMLLFEILRKQQGSYSYKTIKLLQNMCNARIRINSKQYHTLYRINMHNVNERKRYGTTGRCRGSRDIIFHSYNS